MSNLITNDREAFQYVKNMLLKQDEKSTDLSDNCQYRGWSEELVDEVRHKIYVDPSELDDEEDFDSNRFLDREDELLWETIASMPTNTKCAAGWLIHDNFYHQNFEGETVNPASNDIWDVIKLSNPVWFTTEKSLSMVKQLQSIHDQEHVSDWSEKFESFEDRFNAYGDYTGSY